MFLLQKKVTREINFIFLFLIFFFFALISFAQGAEEAKFIPLVGLPGVTNLSTTSFPDYINAIYLLLIGLGGLIAVVRIGLIGVRYSMSESIIHKVHAKEEILGTFTGLAILVIPYIVLTAINPNLTNIDVLKFDPIQTTPINSGTPSNPGTPGVPPEVLPGNLNADGTVSVPRILYCKYYRDIDPHTAESTANDTKCRERCSELDGTFTGIDDEGGNCNYTTDENVTPGGA